MDKENKKSTNEDCEEFFHIDIKKCMDLYQKCIEGKLNYVDNLYETNEHCLTNHILTDYIETNKTDYID